MNASYSALLGLPLPQHKAKWRFGNWVVKVSWVEQVVVCVWMLIAFPDISARKDFASCRTVGQLAKESLLCAHVVC